MTILGGANSNNRKDLGDVWSNNRSQGDDSDFMKDCRTDMSGDGSADRVRVCFRNRCEFPLVLCWIDEKQKPYHFYRLDPTADTGRITEKDHIEQTFTGHAFVIAYVPPETSSANADAEEDDSTRYDAPIAKIQQQKTLEGAVLVAGYRSKALGVDDVDDASWHPHLVEIHSQQSKEGCNCGGGPFLRGSAGAREGKKRRVKALIPRLKLAVSLAELDRRPLDTTKKRYTKTTLGGWPVWLDAELNESITTEETLYLKELEADLEVLCKRLPVHARERLSTDTPIWINRTFRYGPAACPIRGKACCFHPDVNWLEENGCHPEKAGCVEVYDLADHHSDRHLWGVGGIMLHEYAHAYHYKCLEGRYQNRPIKQCWDDAMKNKLYDCVRVHGSQGPTAKAYACTDQMEYFAELSAAFLGGLSDDEEYNKWYPFNRKQIKEHDPKAFQLLQDVWKEQCE